MNSLVSTHKRLPANLRDWRWKTSDNLYLRPVVMETRHLHHTLVMIWHHTMPESARVRNYYRRYSFGPFYTKQYMMQAIKIMAAELASRDDLKPYMKRELHFMMSYLREKPAGLLHGGR